MTVYGQYPFAGRWLVQNSPANRVPSHGTELFSTAYAIDFVPVDTAARTAPISVRSIFPREESDLFPGFGRNILAPVSGVVVAAHAEAADHAAYRGFPSIAYALLQRRRVSQGWIALAGNHVMIDTGAGVVALCHLQQSSVAVEIGQQVQAGDVVGKCGNAGNSTQPHLHIQAMTTADINRARAIPLKCSAADLPRNGEIIEAD